MSELNDTKESRTECKFPTDWTKTRTKPTWNFMKQHVNKTRTKPTWNNKFATFFDVIFFYIVEISWGALSGAGRTSPVLLCLVAGWILVPCSLQHPIWCVVMRLSEGRCWRWSWDILSFSAIFWVRMKKSHKDPGTKTVVQDSYIERIFYIQNQLQMAKMSTATIDWRELFTEMSSATERLTTFCWKSLPPEESSHRVTGFLTCFCFGKNGNRIT